MNLTFPRALRLGSFFFGLSSAGTKPEGTAAATNSPECRGSSEAVVDHDQATPMPSGRAFGAGLVTRTGRRQPENRPHNTTRHPRRDLYQTVDYRIGGTRAR